MATWPARVGVLRVQDDRRRHVPEVVVVELLARRLRAGQAHSWVVDAGRLVDACRQTL